MENKKTRYIGFRTTKEIYDRLESIAKEEDRSVSYILNRILREAMKEK